MTVSRIFTSESVSEGHPDKIADQISDAVLDAILKKDKRARVACETLVKNGMVLIAGEITTNAWVDMEQIARNTIKNIGYNNPSYGFDSEACAVVSAIGKQSPDIAMGVDHREDKDMGAGDQGLMFGYATNETPEFMPLPITLAHRLTKSLATARKTGLIKYLRPDGKSQVTIEYQNGLPLRIHTVLISTQHAPEISQEKIKADIIKKIILPALPKNLVDANTKFLVNPTGRFVIGGPQGDTGLTGRKIIVDTYGGACPHGGGAFSGKDPTKVDRSGAYAARYVANNVVASGLAQKVEVKIAYAIGIPEPLAINVNSFGTSIAGDDQLREIITKVFDLRPGMIIKNLDLRKPIYKQVASYGHFGRLDLDLPWEKLDKVNEIKKLAATK